VSGYLATQQNAAPPLLIEAAHAVRDIRATVSQPPQGYSLTVTILQNGAAYGSDLVIGAGELTSNIVSGVSLPPLSEDAALTVNIGVAAIQGAQTASNLSPGRDLTVTIRL